MLSFDWDPPKAELNLRKHGVGFEEAKTVFGDPLQKVAYDPDHSDGEDRYIMVGMSSAGRLVSVVFTDRGDGVRLISARPLSPRERTEYEDGSR